MLEFLLKFFLTAAAIIVIVLVMLQRGKGGGLAGALGGMGGQSAFGTKAGDLFTKITVGVAAILDSGQRLCRDLRPALSGSQITGQQVSRPRSSRSRAGGAAGRQARRQRWQERASPPR